MTTVGTLRRRTAVTGVNNPAYQISKDAWNDSLILASAAPDLWLVAKDATQPDGWGLVAPSQAAAWGAITGSLAAQTDLAAALGGKADLATVAALSAALGTKVDLSGSYADPAWITALAASKLTGALADARLSANVPRLNAAQTWSTLQTFSGGLALTGILTTAVTAIATTSTDGMVLANTTAATVGVPVQQSPRLRFRSNVYNVTGGITNTDDTWIESQPFSAAAPSSGLYFWQSKNGGAPVSLMYIGGVGNPLTVPGGFISGATYVVAWSTRTNLSASAVGRLELQTSSFAAGVGLDFSVDTILKVRTKAQSAYATVDALGYSVSGVAGASKAAGPVTSITVVNGIVTAIS